MDTAEPLTEGFYYIKPTPDRDWEMYEVWLASDNRLWVTRSGRTYNELLTRFTGRWENMQVLTVPTPEQLIEQEL